MTREREAVNTTQSPSPTLSGAGGQGLLGIRWAFPLPNTLVTRARPEPLLLGRGADCDDLLPGAETSRHHAELFRRGPLWVVRDLNSRNGVYVNGRRIELESLVPGDVLRVGEWVGVVRQLASAEAEVGFGELAPSIYGSTALADVLRDARIAARSALRIVVQGETGTGKERLAQAIHAWSGRAGHFVAVNCAALPEPLAEGELFGYRKGAFTGATGASLGHLRSAQGGTLLLDEITELPGAVQAKLLRALEQQAVVPLGESMPIPIDVRVISATQEPLCRAVDAKRFRADLWARLDGITLVLPSLRERSEDTPGLFASLLPRSSLASFPVVDTRLVERLCLYQWPGNVRELAQLAHQMAVLRGTEPVLKRSHLPSRMLEESQAPSVPATAGAAPVSLPPPSEDELRHQEDLRTLVQAMRVHRGNVSLAARELGISRQKAYRRLEELPDSALEAIRPPRPRRGSSKAR